MRIRFRKALAVMISVLMLCTLLPLSAVFSVSAATAALDVNFNDGSKGGFDQGSAVKEGPDGSYCLKWSAGGGYSSTYRSVSGVYRDKTYVIKFKAKSSTSGATMGITIQDGNWGNYYYNEFFKPTTSWAEYTIETNVQDYPTTSGSILFKFQDQGVAMDLWIDDLTITEKVTEPDPEPEVPETPSTSENLVVNGDFENGSNGWKLNSASASIVSGGRTGNALQMKNPTSAYSEIAIQYVDVKPGTGYTISWWSKRTAGTGVFNVYLDGATKTAGGNAWMNETSGQWVQTVIDIKTGDSTNSLMIKLSNEAANTNGTILIDDISLVQHPEASFDGHLYNGDFEIGSLINWTSYSNTAISTAAAHTGTYGVKISGPGDWGGLLFQNSVGVEAGKTYTISMWAKALDAAHGVNIQVKDGGTSGNNLASKYFTTTSWTLVEWTVTPTTNVICLNICGGGTGAAETIYLDDVMLIEEKEPAFDGYIYNGDFETGTKNPWTVYNDTSVNTLSKYEGSYGLYMADSGDWDGFAYQTVSNLKVGKEYVVSMKMKVVSGGVNVQILNGSTGGDKISYSYIDTSKASDWTDITLTFTAKSTTIVLNFCGDGTGVAAKIYVDNVKMERVGGEIFPQELHKFGGTSIKENADGIGLAFKFDIEASNGQRDFSNQYVSGSAKITVDDVQYSVIKMGAVLTNKADIGSSTAKLTLDNVDGGKTINIEGKYMAAVNTNSISFAVRVLDIPERHQGTEIYARPYYVYKDSTGNEVVVYGNIKSDTYAKAANPKSSIKILSIGHSFSKDVMDKYLWDMFKEGGYEEVIIGYLYIAGCPMPKHLYNIQNGRADYEYGKNSNGTWVKKYNSTALYALQDEEWDYVNIQSSPDYIGGQTISKFKLGVNSELEEVTLPTPMTEYECIDPITEWIEKNATNSSVKTDYNMIWSFSQGCDLWSGGAYHKNPTTGKYDQMVMYNNIIEQTKLNVLTNNNVYNVIPCGTAIQNARTSFIGDNFNEPDATQGGNDGYHLNSKYGDYTAALTWYCHYSGDSANVMANYKGQLTDTEFDAIAEAVNNAIENWDEVTESTRK